MCLIIIFYILVELDEVEFICLMNICNMLYSIVQTVNSTTQTLELYTNEQLYACVAVRKPKRQIKIQERKASTPGWANAPTDQEDRSYLPVLQSGRKALKISSSH